MKIYTQTGRLLFLHANGYQTCYDACEHVADAVESAGARPVLPSLPTVRSP